MRRRRVGHLMAATLWVTVLAVALGMLAPVLTTLLVLVFLPLASIVLMRDRGRGPTRPGRNHTSRTRRTGSVTQS